MAVAARYEAVFPFASGLAAARIKGLWGYIDDSGSFVLPPEVRRGAQLPFWHQPGEGREGVGLYQDQRGIRIHRNGLSWLAAFRTSARGYG